MRIPKTFSVKNVLWHLKYKWNLRYDSKKVDGLCDFDQNEVLIDASCDKEGKFWTSVHEFLHAVLDQYELGQHSKKHRHLGRKLEEDVVSAIEIELKENFDMKWKRRK